MGTVDRVLPWRRHHESTTPAELAPLLAAYRSRHPKAPVATITNAYQVAAEAHRNQLRSSGESYINHPLAVARIVAEIGLDEVSVVAALLHDAVEDTEITVADVDRDFGGEIAAIVDGVTKLDRIQFDSREAQQAATMRKMLVAMAADLRVLVIKLADRLHNMRTIAAMPSEKQQRIAQETIDIYAPLAHRLGMQEIKQQLEDLAFAALHPKRYAELDYLVSARSPERDTFLAAAISEVRARLAEVGVEADGHRPRQAPVEPLREDGRQGPRVRRHLRPAGDPHRRQLDEGLLRRARAASTAAGVRSSVASRTTSRCRSSTSTRACTPRSSGRWARRSRCRSAPRRCTSGPSGASPPTGRTRTAPTRRPTSTGSTGSSTGRPTSPTRRSSCRA